MTNIIIIINLCLFICILFFALFVRVILLLQDKYFNSLMYYGSALEALSHSQFFLNEKKYLRKKTNCNNNKLARGRAKSLLNKNGALYEYTEN